jgi:hypothetical protein
VRCNQCDDLQNSGTCLVTWVPLSPSDITFAPAPAIKFAHACLPPRPPILLEYYFTAV